MHLKDDILLSEIIQDFLIFYNRNINYMAKISKKLKTKILDIINNEYEDCDFFMAASNILTNQFKDISNTINDENIIIIHDEALAIRYGEMIRHIIKITHKF